MTNEQQYRKVLDSIAAKDPGAVCLCPVNSFPATHVEGCPVDSARRVISYVDWRADEIAELKRS